MNHDDPLDDLEARLRAWRPTALPPDLHARLLAAEPAPRRPAPRPTRRLAVGALALALAAGWWFTEAPHSTPAGASAARRGAGSGRFVDAAWTPGASLTMNLATGVPVDNTGSPWHLDDDPDTAGGLFGVRFADGKLPLKVDCQF